MFVRGSGKGIESRRVDESFYRGIVVKNNDPLKLHRVKILIPELTNQPYDDWWQKYSSWFLKSPGDNSNQPKNDTIGTLKDDKIFEEVCSNIPWAEQCFPIFGETGNIRYDKQGNISTISDCNYEEGFSVIDNDPPTLENGSFSPAFLYEINETVVCDLFSEPLKNFSVKCNPYSYSYRPSKHVNNSKGVFGIPNVGAKVWVFHWEGDLQFPVYFGSSHDMREILPLERADNDYKIGYKYPNEFEN